MRLIILIICLPILLAAQPPMDRYQAAIFSTVTETNDIKFSTGVPQPEPGGGFYEFVTGLPLNVDEFDTSPEDLFMDIFEPTGDTLAKRPLIIVAFGGGFVAGSRDHFSMRLICEELAKLGFVTATIDYRLGMNIFDSDLANRAVYRGIQDGRSAIRFFRADAAGANNYRIDPDQIFIGGHSSGAFAALHNIYLDKEDFADPEENERPLSTGEWMQDGNFVPDQGCLDCVGDNQSFSGYANGAFGLAGALGFTSFIETENDPKCVLFHSEDDGTVPYDEGLPFSNLSPLLIGEDFPKVYGSFSIAERSDSVALPYEFYSYTSRGHDVHENGSNLYADIIPGIADWFFEQELKPSGGILLGESIVCNSALEQSYNLKESGAYFFDWQVTGGTFTYNSMLDSAVTVLWDESAPLHTLSVTPYNRLDAKGDSIYIEIEISHAADNNFLAITSDWHDPQNWSLSHVPLVCENAYCNSTIPITSGADIDIHRLVLSANTTLTIDSQTNNSIYHRANSSTNFAIEILGTLINNGDIHIRHSTAGFEVKVEGGTIENNGFVELLAEQ